MSTAQGAETRRRPREEGPEVEVEVGGGVGPWAHFEVPHRVAIGAALLEVEKLGVALMNLDKVRVLVHQMQDCLILLFGSHVKCLNGDLGQTEQLLEHVL